VLSGKLKEVQYANQYANTSWCEPILMFNNTDLAQTLILQQISPFSILEIFPLYLREFSVIQGNSGFVGLDTTPELGSFFHS
jgi:hypothetical protein